MVSIFNFFVFVKRSILWPKINVVRCVPVTRNNSFELSHTKNLPISLFKVDAVVGIVVRSLCLTLSCREVHFEGMGTRYSLTVHIYRTKENQGWRFEKIKIILKKKQISYKINVVWKNFMQTMSFIKELQQFTVQFLETFSKYSGMKGLRWMDQTLILAAFFFILTLWLYT